MNILLRNLFVLLEIFILQLKIFFYNRIVLGLLIISFIFFPLIVVPFNIDLESVKNYSMKDKKVQVGMDAVIKNGNFAGSIGSVLSINGSEVKVKLKKIRYKPYHTKKLTLISIPLKDIKVFYSGALLNAKQIGLLVIIFFMLLLTVFISSSLLFTDENKLFFQSLLLKKVRIYQFVIGKYIGVIFLLFAIGFILSFVFGLVYFYKTGFLYIDTFLGFFPLFFPFMVISSIVIFLSGYIPEIISLILGILLFVGSIFYGINSENIIVYLNSIHFDFVRYLFYLIPNSNIFIGISMYNLGIIDIGSPYGNWILQGFIIITVSLGATSKIFKKRVNKDVK